MWLLTKRSCSRLGVIIGAPVVIVCGIAGSSHARHGLAAERVRVESGIGRIASVWHRLIRIYEIGGVSTIRRLPVVL